MPRTREQYLTRSIGASDESHKVTGSEETRPAAGSPTVRFASVDEEIEPEKSLSSTIDTASREQSAIEDDANLKELSKTLRGAQLAGRRMSAFAFEPVSLPVSRVRRICYNG